MIVLLSVAVVLAGVVLAWAADRHPIHSKALEIFAGISLFAGFGLLGASLWWIVVIERGSFSLSLY
jgi:hypothetical protein